MVFSSCRYFVILALWPLATAAQVTPVDQQRALEIQDEFLGRQQNLDEELQRQLREVRQRRRSVIEVAPDLSKKDKKVSSCLDIKHIEFDGVTLLSNKEIRQMTQLYTAGCMPLHQFDGIIRDITNRYIDKGYVTTRAYIPAQDIKRQVMRIKVVEGVLEDIRPKQSSSIANSALNAAFPFIKNKPFNIRAIEQGLYHINSLASNEATIEILPGSQAGHSIIEVDNNIEDATRLWIGIDNHGQQSTGEVRGELVFEQDNFLGLNDRFSFRYNSDHDQSRGQEDSGSISSSLSIPFGYWRATATASWSEYESRIQGVAQQFTSEGESWNYNLGLERVLSRSKTGKTWWHGGINLKKTESFIAGIKSVVGSRKLSILSNGITHQRALFGGLFSGDLSYDRGLEGFGALEDPAGLGVNNPRAQFDRFTSDLQWYKIFKVKNIALTYKGNLFGQYSPDPLFGSEKLTLGDAYSVRGFKDDSLQTDSGVYLRNELSYAAQNWTKNKRLKDTIGTLQPYIGYDYGYGRSRGGKASNSGEGEGYISGATLGLRNQGTRATFDISVSHGLHSPAFVANNDFELAAKLRVKLF